ncbi:unnamed protein product [Durusdinium trenchii]|uniref:Uncharacterized protein n=1 Tax=Durusdinium trenchii TaxID=1381693 RepID=A0ABP0SZ61_9DINO
MSNAGLEGGDAAKLTERLVLRLLAFAVDVLPEFVTELYADDLAEAGGFNRKRLKNIRESYVTAIDLKAKRELTLTEKLIKDELAFQAEHGEKMLTEAQTWDVDNLGVRIFLFHESGLATMRSLLETALLFTPLHTKGVAPLAAKRNVDFLKKYMGIDIKTKRVDHGELVLNESDIHSGDFLGVIRMDGLDPMLAFGMGSHTGHTAVALWEEGQLYVAESTVNSSYWYAFGR